MQWAPHVTVAAVIEREEHFLVVEEQVHGRLLYNQPAGHWEVGESLTAGAVRETLEETGWDFEPQALLGVYHWVHPGKSETYLRFCFTGPLLQHHPQRPLDTGIVRAVWMSRDELAACRDRHRSPLVLACVDDYLAGKRFPLTLLNEHA